MKSTPFAGRTVVITGTLEALQSLGVLVALSGPLAALLVAPEPVAAESRYAWDGMRRCGS